MYRGKEPIYDTFGVETQVNRSLGRKVWLKSGIGHRSNGSLDGD